MSASALPDVLHSRVVVVDDNLPSLQLVRSLLGRSGYTRVHAITDGRELLGHYDQLAPELVLLDLHMPGIDGYAVLDRIRQRATPADLPVLVLTADTTREATRRALELGANDFLTKPLDAAELVLRVRNLLQTRALHVDLQRRHRWLEASGRLAADLLAEACPEPLRRVSQLALAAAEADAAVVALPSVGDRGPAALGAHVWVGDESGAVAAAIADAGAAGALDHDAPRLVDDLGALAGRPGSGSACGPAMVVPLVGADRTVGALVLCRRRDRPQFTEIDLELARGFASQAVVAVQFAQARADQERMMLLSERHRIARDLHDQVIQRLFATGLRLQQIASRMSPDPVADRIDERVDELDQTISEIRSTIFGLRQEFGAGPERLAAQLQEIADDMGEVLGFEPVLRLTGRLDTVPEIVAEDLLAATREAVTNVAKHARARHVEISVLVTAEEVVLDVVDDGRGVTAGVRRSGLANLAERARRHGGRFAVLPGAGRGTRIQWSATLRGTGPRGGAQLPAATMPTGR